MTDQGITEQEPQYGAKLFIKISNINMFKDCIIDTLLPDGRIQLEIQDQEMALIKLSNMNGFIQILKDNVEVKGKDGKLGIEIKEATLLLNMTFNRFFISQPAHIQARFAFSIETQFGRNDMNQLIIDEIAITEFHFVDLFEKLPDTIKDIMNDLTYVIQKGIQKQVENSSKDLKGKLNKILSTLNPDRKIGSTSQSFDTTFHISNVDDDKVTIQGYFFSFNNFKAKQRPSFLNGIPFPDEVIDSKVTLYISEYMFNSALYTYLETGAIYKQLPQGFIKRIQQISKFLKYFTNINEKFLKSEKLFVQILSNSPPKTKIDHDKIDADVDLNINLISIIKGQEDEVIMQLDAKMSSSFKAEFIEDNKKVRLTIMDYNIKSIKYIDKGSKNLRFLKMLLNNVIPFLLADSENCLNLKIPIENQFFKLDNANIEFIDHHIKIEADPIFYPQKLSDILSNDFKVEQKHTS